MLAPKFPIPQWDAESQFKKDALACAMKRMLFEQSGERPELFRAVEDAVREFRRRYGTSAFPDDFEERYNLESDVQTEEDLHPEQHATVPW